MASSTRNTKIVRPTEVHKATILCLHDIGQDSKDSARFARTLNLPNVKWICPTAPRRSVTYLGGTEATAWCDLTEEIADNMGEDVVSLNSSVALVINFLKDEPENVMRGLVGIGLGAAVALHYATTYVTRVMNLNLRFIVGINGWIPTYRSFLHSMTFDYGSPSLAALVPILITQGKNDEMVPFEFGRICANTLHMAGFPITFNENDGYHLPILPQVIDHVRLWITYALQL